MSGYPLVSEKKSPSWGSGEVNNGNTPVGHSSCLVLVLTCWTLAGSGLQLPLDLPPITAGLISALDVLALESHVQHLRGSRLRNFILELKPGGTGQSLTLI